MRCASLILVNSLPPSQSAVAEFLKSFFFFLLHYDIRDFRNVLYIGDCTLNIIIASSKR